MSKNSQLLVDLGPGLSLMLGLPRIEFWDTDTRPQKPKRGLIGFNTQTSSLEYYDGSDWLGATLNKG